MDDIELLEATSVTAQLDHASCCVRLEIVDGEGKGAAFLLDTNELTSLILALIGAKGRLMGWAGEELP